MKKRTRKMLREIIRVSENDENGREFILAVIAWAEETKKLFEPPVAEDGWHELPVDYLPKLIEKTKLEERNLIVSFLRDGEGLFDDRDDMNDEAKGLLKGLAAGIAGIIELGRHESNLSDDEH